MRPLKATFKKPPSRKGTKRAAGRIWIFDGEGYRTDFDDRTVLATWPFDQIHQGKIIVRYPWAKTEHGGIGKSVGLSLEPKSIQIAAMRNLVTWANNIRSTPSVSVKDFIAKQMETWPRLYSTELHLMNHIFFTIGNGFSWLDGQIISLYPDNIETEKSIEGNLGIVRDCDPEELKKVSWYPMSLEYSLVNCVPDDVLPDWLEWAYTAAIQYRDDPADQHGYKAGAQVVFDIEKRFPQLGGDATIQE